MNFIFFYLFVALLPFLSLLVNTRLQAERLDSFAGFFYHSGLLKIQKIEQIVRHILMDQIETALLDIGHEMPNVGETGLNFGNFQLTAEISKTLCETINQLLWQPTPILPVFQYSIRFQNEILNVRSH